MGSVLGLIFSNFLMSDLENKIFENIKKPSIYQRYFDNILILANDINELNIQPDTFQKNSVLNFTHELNKNNGISFLDVLIDTNNKNDNFTIYTNKTTLITTPVPSTLKVNVLSDLKKVIMNNLISCAKLIFSFQILF